MVAANDDRRRDVPLDEDLVPVQDACPMCGERHADRLVWIDDDRVRCQNCKAEYAPRTEGHNDVD